tara:strand:- start:17 stop:367 length:351 start_codon:yes stop_codon:yes gene_type:complete
VGVLGFFSGPYIKKANYPNLQRFPRERYIMKHFLSPLYKKILQKKIMSLEFSQAFQDERTRVLEHLVRREGHLDTRMYEFSQDIAEKGIFEDVEALYTLWEQWKSKFPTPQIINRL